MSTIRKRGNRWEAQVRKKGQAPISKSFIMKSDALEWGRNMELAADRRSLPYDPRQLDGITLRAMLEKYRDEVIPKKRSPEREINLLNAFIARSPKLAAMPLSSLSPAPFCTYRDQRLKTVKPATICRELGLIQHAYDIAEKEWGYPLQENPVAKVKKPEIRNRRERRLTWSEFKAMQKSLKQCENKEMQFLSRYGIGAIKPVVNGVEKRWKAQSLYHSPRYTTSLDELMVVEPMH